MPDKQTESAPLSTYAPPGDKKQRERERERPAPLPHLIQAPVRSSAGVEINLGC